MGIPEEAHETIKIVFLVYGCVNFALMVPCLIYAIVRAVIGKKTTKRKLLV